MNNANIHTNCIKKERNEEYLSLQEDWFVCLIYIFQGEKSFF
jgi:hypothetical protein